MKYTWDVISTPFGAAVGVAGERGLVWFHLIDGDPQWEIERVSAQLGTVPVSSPGSLAELCEQIEEYSDGKRREFDVELDWSLVSGFTLDALQAVTEIPYGATASYGEIALVAGRPRAARAVGTACRLTPFSLIVPVHRVVRSDGSVGEYGAHPETKRALLELEGAIAPRAVPRRTTRVDDEAADEAFDRAARG
ncbi:methylated-DNA--[protein]-cysteine S-methyltransferase [Microbacterium sp. ZW T5_56]|uniref:methylated-DNA--[protein]-cysteine S-methyltransferase n=1 Tax=Microbacterium sp. ZW T5_56 TaxID=3378081 RepID=UPI003852D9E6